MPKVNAASGYVPAEAQLERLFTENQQNATVDAKGFLAGTSYQLVTNWDVVPQLSWKPSMNYATYRQLVAKHALLSGKSEAIAVEDAIGDELRKAQTIAKLQGGARNTPVEAADITTADQDAISEEEVANYLEGIQEESDMPARSSEELDPNFVAIGDLEDGGGDEFAIDSETEDDQTASTRG